MKEIILENRYLIPAINLLATIEWSKTAGRGYGKFNKRLLEKHEEFKEDLKDIQKEYFVINKDGEFLEKDGQLQYRKDVTDEQKKEANTRVDELMNETSTISFNEYSTKFDAMFEDLTNTEMKFKGVNAIAYDELMDAYENNLEEEK